MKDSEDSFRNAEETFEANFNKYNSSIMKARLESQDLREQHRSNAEKYRDDCFEKARKNAGSKIEEAMDKLNRDVENSLNEIDEQSEALSEHIVEMLLASGGKE